MQPSDSELRATYEQAAVKGEELFDVYIFVKLLTYLTNVEGSIAQQSELF